MKRFAKLLLSYLREHILYFLYLIGFCIIFAVILYLYRIETEAVFYASVLCLLLGVIFFSVSFRRFLKKQAVLEDVGKNIFLASDNLPDTCSAHEREYIKMIKTLLLRIRELEEERDTERNDNIDYYTKWVHQIKTPIAVMKLELQQEDSELNRLLLAELFKTEQYVEMVLCRFRLDSYSNDFVIKRQPVDPIIKSAVRKYSHLFIRRKIRLVVTASDKEAVTDKKWLGFIIEQIFSNAVKYTDNGEVSVYIDSADVLHIKDTGIGIAPEDLPRIFEKGYTGYNGREESRSTGLGLYLCKKAADKLSHRITVYSEVGKGSDFMIDLSADLIQAE